jgi:DNA-directed RNA polymerase III subunit RPC4
VWCAAKLTLLQGDGPENLLYLFQFPGLFPSFAAPSAAAAPELSSSPPKEKGKRSVAFAADVRGPADRPEVKTEEGERRVEGQVGRLDVCKDGKVALRFGDVQMEVSQADCAVRSLRC